MPLPKHYQLARLALSSLLPPLPNGNVLLSLGDAREQGRVTTKRVTLVDDVARLLEMCVAQLVFHSTLIRG